MRCCETGTAILESLLVKNKRFEPFLTFLFFSLCFLAPTTVVAEKETVTIGVILPLTGGASVYGEDARRIAPLLAKRVNAESQKYTFRFVLEDGKCGVGNAATTAAQKLISIDGAKFLAAGCSGEMLQVGPFAQRRKVITNCFACSHRDIKNIGPYAFRTYPDIEQGVHDVAQRIKTDVTGSVAVFTENNAFTIGIGEQLKEELAKQIGYSAEFEMDQDDFKTLFTRARAASPAAYYLNAATPRSYQVMFKQLRDLGVKAPVYTYYMAGDHSSLKALGELQNGVRYFALPEELNSSDGFIEFDKAFRALYSEPPEAEFLYRASYDVLTTYVKAIEEVGTDVEKVRARLIEGGFFGALGTLTFDKNGDLKNVDFVMNHIVAGDPAALQ